MANAKLWDISVIMPSLLDQLKKWISKMRSLTQDMFFPDELADIPYFVSGPYLYKVDHLILGIAAQVEESAQIPLKKMQEITGMSGI